ncbi:MAG: MFS transporter [Rhodospirillales bacterium]|nr:MFS transporter [Rhodospirillales bacterium]MDE2198509.1 MFS transporter [Rhodospirillales bacterium]MDE2575779.1 MFS transporter [Rhodospirillales bacterium]
MQAAKLPITQNRWWRILGVSFVMYVLSFIDRTNLAMAVPSMRSDLHMSAAAIGAATSMFFWGYFILQIPTGRLAGVWSAKKVIFIQLLFWAAISLTTAFVRTPEGLWWNRFALGIAEGGVLTCTIVLIRHWFTRAERARANTIFLLSLAIAPVIANPISGVVLHYGTWRTMFMLEALPGLVWGLVWLWAIADRPGQAAWLPAAERERLEAELAAEAKTVPPRDGHWLAVLVSAPVLLLVLYNFGALAAEWGINFWLPSVVKETGAGIVTVGLLSALPYAAGAVMMVLVARSSDHRQERKYHMILATCGSGVFLFCAQFATGFGPYAAIFFLTLAVGSFLGRFGPFWTLPSEVLPPAVAGVGIGLINGAGNLGGTVGPWFFGVVRDHTGSFSAALTAGGLSLIVASLVALPIRVQRGTTT